jgi:hypothetical protein
MKMIIIGACVLFLGGCGVIPQKSEIPEQELLVDDKVHSMSRLRGNERHPGVPDRPEPGP